MEILHQYYYRKGSVVTKAVFNTFLSIVFIALGAFFYVHWEMSFLFSDWKGWVIVVIYGLITIGTILSAIGAFRKISKVTQRIPAFAVCADRLIVYDKHGLPNEIHFEDCDGVRIKRDIRYRGAPPTLTLIVKYHDKMDVDNTNSLEIDLSELDCPDTEIDRQLHKVYRKYKSGTTNP